MAFGRQPWPNGVYEVRIGGRLIGSDGAEPVDSYVLPFDAYVEYVRYHYYQAEAADLDAVSLASSGSASKTIVAAADMSGDIAGTAQTLHADVASHAYRLRAGDVILLSADSTGATEGGNIHATIGLRPVDY